MQLYRIKTYRKYLFKSFTTILFLFLFVTNVVSHEQWMHQYITREAFKLLKKSFPNELSAMENFIGYSETEGYDKSWGALKVVSGTWIEDEYDVVYHYGCWERPNFDQSLPDWVRDILDGEDNRAYTSITHFWNADHPDPYNATLLSDEVDGGIFGTFYWSHYCPNAYAKMKKYENGNYIYRWIYDQVTHYGDCYGILRLADDFPWISLRDLYIGIGAVSSLSYLDMADDWIYAYGCPTFDAYDFNHGYAYEILGRMCHLVQDMSVPAHAHCNAHAGAHGMYDDYYEHHTINFQHPTADDIWNSGESFINPYHSTYPYDDPIYFLMYFMNQITDHFADGEISGDDIYDLNCPLISDIIPNLGLPTSPTQINDQNCRLMHSILLRYAIRATAGLMYWFAWEAGQLPNSNTTNGSLSHNELWCNIHTLNGNVTIPSGISLRISPGTHVYIPSGKKITVEGTILVEGKASERITFNKSGSSKWWGIKFEDSSDDDECILQYCTIQNASYGAYCYKSSTAIKNCNINNNTTGIYKAYGASLQDIFDVDVNYAPQVNPIYYNMGYIHEYETGNKLGICKIRL